jgi:hypothetical protein
LRVTVLAEIPLMAGRRPLAIAEEEVNSCDKAIVISTAQRNSRGDFNCIGSLDLIVPLIADGGVGECNPDVQRYRSTSAPVLRDWITPVRVAPGGGLEHRQPATLGRAGDGGQHGGICREKAAAATDPPRCRVCRRRIGRGRNCLPGGRGDSAASHDLRHVDVPRP